MMPGATPKGAIQMQAAVLREANAPRPYRETKPMHIETIWVHPPGRGEVLVRVKAAGLCHSDLSVINGDRPRPLPMVLGHEAAGEVVALGDGVEDLAEGDHVVMVFVPSCGGCICCAEGRPNICAPALAANGAGTLHGGHLRLADADGPVYHHLGVSAFAEYAVVSRKSLVRIDQDLPFVTAALFGCAVLTGVGAVVNNARLSAGQSAVVVGLGGIGLAAVMGAAAAGAATIVAVDFAPDKLALARHLGATEVISAAEPDAVESVRALTGGGADFAFDMAGRIPALQSAIAMTRRGGTTVSAGLPPAGQTLPLDASQLVAEERILKGSYVGSCVPSRDIPRFIDLFRRGRLPVDRLLTTTLRLDEINGGFDRMEDGEAIRQVVIF